MPLVSVVIGKKPIFAEENLRRLGELIQAIVATELTCEDPEGQLTPSDIEVSFRYRNSQRDVGGEKYDIQVTVFANDFPSRKANLSARCEEIKHRLAGCFGTDFTRGFVWVLLAPAAFAEWS